MLNQHKVVLLTFINFSPALATAVRGCLDMDKNLFNLFQKDCDLILSLDDTLSLSGDMVHLIKYASQSFG